jgi:hypothetical protein
MMKLLSDGQGRGILLMEPALWKFHRYLMLLAHARSYSTLLCHILGSHPQICGYSEAMIPYETAVDLIRLNCAVFRAGNSRGAVGSGDTSATIRSGRIIRDRDDREEAPIPIPCDLLDRARHAYGECLAACCTSPVLSRAGG